VSSLPHDDDDNDADDEFAFHFSLPEFAALNIEARSSLSSLPCKSLQGVVTHTEDDYERGNDDVVNDTHDDDDNNHNNILEYEFEIQNYGNDVPTPVMHYTNVFHHTSHLIKK
jgi:hypothetical protein